MEEMKTEEKIVEVPTSSEPITKEVKEYEKPAYLQLVLPASILLASLIISGTLLYTKGATKNNPNPGTANIGNQPAAQAQQVNLTLNSSDHLMGSNKAKVTVIEYSDLQCPFCRLFWKQTLPQIKKEYIDTGKVLFVYRHYPLDFHPMSTSSAKAVECANESGKFWEMHDKIFQEEQKLGDGTVQYALADLKKWASEIGLNSSSFNTCLDSDKYSQRIKDDTASGNQSGVSGTPTLFINGQKIVGAQPYTTFKSAIDGALR